MPEDTFSRFPIHDRHLAEALECHLEWLFDRLRSTLGALNAGASVAPGNAPAEYSLAGWYDLGPLDNYKLDPGLWLARLARFLPHARVGKGVSPGWRNTLAVFSRPAIAAAIFFTLPDGHVLPRDGLEKWEEAYRCSINAAHQELRSLNANSDRTRCASHAIISGITPIWMAIKRCVFFLKEAEPWMQPDSHVAEAREQLQALSRTDVSLLLDGIHAAVAFDGDSPQPVEAPWPEFMSANDLADRLQMPREATRKKLERLGEKCDCFREVESPAKGEPKKLYVTEMVRPHLAGN
jgi:hypothetical protein